MSSNTNDEAASPTAAGGTANEASTSQAGYCHICDRQVTIDPDSFTCTVCNGGFIELFEAPPAEPEPQIPNIHRILNDGNNPFSQLLPMLLPQLMGQTGAQNISSHRININRPQAQTAESSSSNQSGTPGQQGASNQQDTQSQQNTPAPQDTTGPQVFPGQQSSPGQSTARLQFIVPNSETGNQIDLYGIINNVLSDLLRPGGATGGMPMGMQINIPGMQQQGAHFHFQPPPIRMFQLHGDMRDYAWGPGGLDTIITQLLNQLENTGPPPATEQQLDNLPTIKITEDDVRKNLECAICMEDFNLNDEVKKLPCKHCFHEPCIKEWLKLHGTCPVCRKNLNGEDTSQQEYVSPLPTEPNSGETSTSATSAPETTNNSTTNASSNAGNSNQTDNSNQGPQVYNDMDFD